MAAETPGGDFKKFTRRKSSAAAVGSSEHRSPTIYDWFSSFYFYFFVLKFYLVKWHLCHLHVTFILVLWFALCRVIMSSLDRFWERKWDVLLWKSFGWSRGIMFFVHTTTQIPISIYGIISYCMAFVISIILSCIYIVYIKYLQIKWFRWCRVFCSWLSQCFMGFWSM